MTPGIADFARSTHVVEFEDVAARCSATTLITGSTAADVEHLARRIHAASSRAAYSFVQASAAELPVEPSALTKTCAGLIQAVAGGTLLLTTIDAMPAIAQDRFIETLVELQGGLDQSVAIRLMAGTTVRLSERVAQGGFSERLFYRLNIIHVVMNGNGCTGGDSAAE